MTVNLTNHNWFVGIISLWGPIQDWGIRFVKMSRNRRLPKEFKGKDLAAGPDPVNYKAAVTYDNSY